MTAYQEDPFQLIRNVGWGSKFAVLSFRAQWKATLDFPNNPFVACGTKAFLLYGNPVDVRESGIVYVTGKPIYRIAETSGGELVTTVTDHYTFDATADNPPDESAFFGVSVFHITANDGTDFWAGNAGSAPSLAEYVALAMVGFSSFEYHNVQLVGSTSASHPKPTLWTVEQNALVFIRLSSFAHDGLANLVTQFDTGLRPFPDETIETYYRWQATLATFRSATLATFTSTNNVPGAWIDTKSASKLSFGNVGANQLHEYLLEFDVDLTTLAVTGSQTLTG